MLALAGCDRLTVSPKLLQDMDSMSDPVSRGGVVFDDYGGKRVIFCVVSVMKRCLCGRVKIVV